MQNKGNWLPFLWYYQTDFEW